MKRIICAGFICGLFISTSILASTSRALVEDLHIAPNTLINIEYEFNSQKEILYCFDKNKMLNSDINWRYKGHFYGHGLPAHLHNHFDGQIDRADPKGTISIRNYDKSLSMLVTCLVQTF